MGWDVTWDGPDLPSVSGFSESGESNGSMVGSWFVLSGDKSCYWREGTSGVSFNPSLSNTAEVKVKHDINNDLNCYISVCSRSGYKNIVALVYQDKLKVSASFDIMGGVTVWHEYAHDFTSETRVRIMMDFVTGKQVVYINDECKENSHDLQDGLTGEYSIHIAMHGQAEGNTLSVSAWRFQNTEAKYKFMNVADTVDMASILDGTAGGTDYVIPYIPGFMDDGIERRIVHRSDRGVLLDAKSGSSVRAFTKAISLELERFLSALENIHI